jgi:hypothetical protein
LSCVVLPRKVPEIIDPEGMAVGAPEVGMVLVAPGDPEAGMAATAGNPEV